MANIHDVNESLQVQPSVKNLPTLIALSQGENGRSLQFRMVGATIPSGSSASLSGTKPDGVVYSKTGTVDGNTVIFQEDVQLTAVAGAWDAKIHIVNSGDSIATALIRFIIEPDPVAEGAIPSDSQLEGIVAECRAYAEEARSSAYGSPLVASLVADMIDHTRVYVYVGNEDGYTTGNWHYWNGTAWTSGGVYNSAAVQLDTTLTLAGVAAEAKAVGDALKDKADKSGVIDNAKQLLSTIHTTNSEPYTFRAIPEGAGDREYLSVVGGSLGWNQLVQNGNFEDSTGWTASNGTLSVSNNEATLTGTSSSTPSISSYVSIDQNHVHMIVASILPESGIQALAVLLNNSASVYRNESLTASQWNRCVGLFKPNVTGSTLFLYSNHGANTGKVTRFKNVFVIDLTACFGTTIADYIYSLEQASAGTGVAFVKRYIDLDTYHEYDAGSIQSVEGLESHKTYDDDENLLATYPLDSSLTLRGVPKLVTDHIEFDGDKYHADGTLERRYGERAYQSGDESLADAITDGTTTVYKLTTPTTETAQPFTSPQICAGGGTEEFVSNSLIPVGSIAEYPADLRKQIENIYGLPKPPLTDGNYRPIATVSGGVLTFSWVSDS